MSWFDLIHVLPDENDAHALRQWRVRIAQVSCSAFLFLFALLVPFLVLAFFTGLPRLGSVVWAAELDQKIDTAVEKAVAPIRIDVTQIKDAVNDLTEANKKSTAAALGNVIINATRERCRALAQQRNADAWTDRVFELRKQYHDLTGEHFMPLNCLDV